MVPRGLDRVTFTPGSTAPDGSEMVPPIAPTPCAIASRVEHIQHDNMTMRRTKSLALIVIPLFDTAGRVFRCDCLDDRERSSVLQAERPPDASRQVSLKDRVDRPDVVAVTERRVERAPLPVLTPPGLRIIETAGHRGCF